MVWGKSAKAQNNWYYPYVAIWSYGFSSERNIICRLNNL